MIALDTPSERIVKDLAASPWQRATFLTASAFSGAPQAGRALLDGRLGLNDLAGRTKNLVDEVVYRRSRGDGGDGRRERRGGGLIGEACTVKHVMTTALILGGAGRATRRCRKCWRQLRPHAMMLVISSADEYIKDMLDGAARLSAAIEVEQSR